jgi:hypothetical protein
MVETNQYNCRATVKFMNLIRCKSESEKKEKLSLHEISTDKLEIGWWEGCGEGGITSAASTINPFCHTSPYYGKS